MRDFVPLAQITLSHEYFGADRFAGFTLRPCPVTAKRLARSGIKTLQNVDTLTLYFDLHDGAGAPPTSRAAAIATSGFLWRFSPPSEIFSLYTALIGAGPKTSIVLHPSLAPSSHEAIPLTQKARVGENDLRLVRPPRFDFCPAHPFKHTQPITLCSSSGTELVTVPSANRSLIPIDTSSYGAGFYLLKQGHNVLFSWFANEGGPELPLDGAYIFIPGAALASATVHSVARPTTPHAASSAPPLRYTARFPARAVKLRYNIFNYSGSSSAPLSIIPKEATLDGDAHAKTPAASAKSRSAAASALRFMPVPGVTGSDAVVSRSFETDQAIKLQQPPTVQFQLRAGTTTLVDPLPAPSLELGPAHRGPGLCSEIFVYL